MKKFIVPSYISLLCLALVTTSCDYDYLTDGGVHNPAVNMTTYDYLASHSWRVFDTLLLLVDHYDMKSEVNAAGTVLAVTDYSLRQYMRPGWTLDSLKKYVTADTLRGYLFDERIEWSDLSTQPLTYVSNSGNEYRFQLLLYNATQWTVTPAYRLNVQRVVGMTTVANYCQTTNIHTTTGVIHAMENLHYFNFGLY